MKIKPSDWIALILAALVVGAFFLPWAKPSPSAAGTLGALAREFNRTLGTEHEFSFQDFFVMREDEWKAAIHQPFEGISGFELPQRVNDKSLKGRMAAAYAELLFGRGAIEQKSLLVWLYPLTALTGALMVIGLGKKKTLLWFPIGLGLILALFLRYKMLSTDFVRAMTQVYAGLGLWITYYGLWIFSLWLVVKLFLPAKGKF